MSLTAFLERVNNNAIISFNETIDVITQNYHYQPTEFSNGLGKHRLINKAGSNEGSCKIFCFAKINQLNEQQTLNLFGDFYRHDVLNNPTGTDHQNIRNFIQYGWAGVSFPSPSLTALQP